MLHGYVCDKEKEILTVFLIKSNILWTLKFQFRMVFTCYETPLFLFFYLLFKNWKPKLGR